MEKHKFEFKVIMTLKAPDRRLAENIAIERLDSLKGMKEIYPQPTFDDYDCDCCED